ncbi:hypothetical protein [Nocardia asiatica]|uniref:hypothetical protein n=1 Tax=Nocardia asiatica TaxID=209252 RepID=UPI003EE264CC
MVVGFVVHLSCLECLQLGHGGWPPADAASGAGGFESFQGSFADEVGGHLVYRGDDVETGTATPDSVVGRPHPGSYQPLHAAYADLAARAGDVHTARLQYRRTLDLTTNPVERAELQRRIDNLPSS